MTAYNVVSPGSLVGGEPEDVSVILANFQAISDIINGNLDNVNIKEAAGILASKLANFPNDAAKVLKGDGSWGGVPGADLVYEGDYVPATTYQDGDVVVKDGIAYLCVGGPTTVAPDPAPWGASTLLPTYGTTLPASPVDGQEAILVDSTTNPSYQWRFRYNAGSSSAYKWEFIGGSKVIVAATGSATINTTAYNPLSPPAAFTVPRAGDYRCGVSGYAYFNNAPVYTCYVGVRAGSTDPADNSFLTFVNGSVGGGAGSYSGPSGFVEGRINAIAASAVVQAVGRCDAATVGLGNPKLSVVPVRVA